MVNSCPLEKGKDVSNKQCYGLSASTKKKSKNTEVFTKKKYFWNWDSRLYPAILERIYNNERIAPS